LKLKGIDKLGGIFEEVATTENVSLSGFLCGCTTKLSADSIVDVYLTSAGEELVGKAKVAHADSQNSSSRRYGFHFVEKIGPWVLQ
jgi:hypothetical protein